MKARSARASTRPGCPDPGPRDPDRWRAAPLQLPDLAVGLRRVLLHRGPAGRTSVRTPSTPPFSSSPAAIAASAADGRDHTMRERAISAAVLVPVLLVVLALGGLVLAAGVAVLTVLAAIEAFRLLRGAGYTTFSALGTVLALVVVIVAALPDLLGGKALLLAAVGTILIAVAGFTIEEPREGLEAWMATAVRCALRLAAVVHHPPRTDGARRAERCAAQRARCRTRLDPAARASRCGRTTPAHTSSARTSGGRSS